MGEVVSLAQFKEENTPHITGSARCLCCSHEWVAVAPVGTSTMECPSCSTNKGVFKNTVMRGDVVRVCNCGCDLFQVHPDLGVYCLVCGQVQEIG